MIQFVGCLFALALSLHNSHSQAATTKVGKWFDHVLIVVLENQDYDAVLQEPYMQALAQMGVLFSDFHAIKHPSYPNYLAMVSGGTFGIADNTQRDINARTIADRLEAKGLSWRQYAQGYPGGCFAGVARGRYARRHVPFLSFSGIRNNPARCASIVSARKFKPSKLPNYALFTPNLDNNGHDTGLDFATRWLQRFLDPFLSQPDRLQNTLIVVTFDESGPTDKNNHVFTVFLGAGVTVGLTDNKARNHYSVLRTIEENFGLKPLRRHDLEMAPITEIWNK